MIGATEFILAAILSTARAEETWTGNRLYAACQERQTASSDCTVVIRGVVDRYHDFIASHSAPQPVSFDDIVERVMTDLEANSSVRDRPATQLILDSIDKAYGCRFQDAPR
jgi:hypothetical protein